MIYVFVVILLIGIWLIGFSLLRRTPGSKAPPTQTLKYQNAPIELEVQVVRSEEHEPPVDLTPNFTEIDKDNWEGSFWEVQEPFPVRATLRIVYEDGAGMKSQRVVDVRQFGADIYGGLLIGHCRMRNATRTFRTERIKQCIDEDTGEIIDDAYAYLLAKYKSSPEYIRDKLLEEEYDAIRVLFYVGKADGQLRAAEKQVILGACQSLANDSRLTEAHINDMYAEMDLPSIQAFKMAVGRLAKRGPDICSNLINAAEDIIATQKTVHPSEKEALDYMRKRFAIGRES